MKGKWRKLIGPAIAGFAGFGAAPLSVALPIHVAVYQVSNYGSADAAGHVANQLNDDTYFDFTATVFSNASLLDTVAELSAYDVVVIGDDGHGQSIAGWNQMGPALSSWVNAGGHLVTTAWTPYFINSLNASMQNILPVSGAAQYVHSQNLVVTNNASPITIGVNTFLSPVYQNYGTPKPGTNVYGYAGSPGNGAIVEWPIGVGTVISLSPEYMGSRTAYGTSLNGLESGDADRLLEQSVAFGFANGIPEPATLALLSLSLAGLGLGRRKKA